MPPLIIHLIASHCRYIIFMCFKPTMLVINVSFTDNRNNRYKLISKQIVGTLMSAHLNCLKPIKYSFKFQKKLLIFNVEYKVNNNKTIKPIYQTLKNTL